MRPFHFRALPLWKEKARKYLEQHAIEMYALLPTMEGADLTLLNEAISEVIKLYKDDQPKLARELRWMGVMLHRADIVPLEDKFIIERRLSMYDDLMEKDPKMQRLFAEREARGRAEGVVKGEARGEAKTLRMVILAITQQRFPSLVKLTNLCVKQLKKPEELRALFEQINTVHDEQEARALIENALT